MAELPRPFGPYLLIESLQSYGADGAGEAFLAADPSLEGEQACVVKRLVPELRGAADAQARFRREAHLARRLSHETLVNTLAVGDAAGEPYLVQEFVEGHLLDTLLDRCAGERRRMPIEAAVFVAHEIARALDYMHGFEGLKLVHRDVSPARIRVGYEGQVKLLEPRLGRWSGKPGAVLEARHTYAAPEQLGTQPVDGRADVYALGAVLWHALSGRPLVGEAQTAPLGEARAREAVPLPSAINPEVLPALDQVVLRMLARQPDGRFASARDVEAALATLDMRAGQESLAALMSRLFDAQRERKQRASLMASAQKAIPAGATQLVVVNPAAATEERELPRMPRNEPPATESPQGEVAPLKPVEPQEARATRSVTIHVRQAGPWLRRFFLVFGLALAAAVAFNRYMTKRLQAEWDAEGAGEAQSPAATQPVAKPSSPALAAPPERTAEPAAESPSSLGASVAPGKAAPVGGAHSAAVASGPESRPRTAPLASSESAKAVILERARAAFERDEFAKAVELGQAALSAGDGHAHAVLGAAYFKLGRYRDAERAYEEAARIEPDNPALKKRAEFAHRMADGDAGSRTP